MGVCVTYPVVQLFNQMSNWYKTQMKGYLILVLRLLIIQLRTNKVIKQLLNNVF